MTDAGKRLLWMLDDRPDIKAFDAKLVRRIVEEFVPRIEAEAALRARLIEEAK